VRYLYSARLAPIGKPVNVPFEDGTPSFVTFEADTFELERKSKTKPEIWIDHRRDLRIGKVGAMYTDLRREWWCCDFMLDRDVRTTSSSRLVSPSRLA
jgi:hypothetical protein